jgi:uncharacterized protein (TIGR02444 family)
MPPLQLDNAFWRFSLAVYAAPGVADQCLALQRSHGIDVNLLLFAAWIGAERGTALSQADMQRFAGAVEGWRQTVVVPLRNLRQAMKPLAEMQHAEAASLRQEIAASELRAEQIEQAMLFAAAADRPGGSDADRETLVRRNVRTLMQTYAQPDQAACERLIAAALSTRPAC